MTMEEISPIFATYSARDRGTLSRLLDQGLDVDIQDKLGRTVLMHAAVDEEVEFVRLLLKHRARVNLKEQRGWTALHFAAQSNNAVIVQLLLENFAEVDVLDDYGNSPLWRAVFNSKGRGEVIELLLEHGADRNLKNNSDISPYDLASTISNYDVKQFFK